MLLFLFIFSHSNLTDNRMFLLILARVRVHETAKRKHDFGGFFLQYFKC